MVLGSRGPRSTGLRTVVGTVVVTMLVGPLRVAYGISAPPPANGGAVPAAPHLGSPGPLPQRFTPTKIDVLAGGLAPETVARAFDGQAQTGLTTAGAPVRFRIQLAAPAYVDAVTLFGKTEGFLAVDADGPAGSSSLLPRSALSNTTSGWSRRAAAEPVLAESLMLSFEPARPDATLRGIEIWGRAASSEQNRGVAATRRALSRVPAGGREWTATRGRTDRGAFDRFGAGSRWHLRRRPRP